ncbi:MAG: HPr family phosphocarrier protein [Clostridia bacterium]|nr:HPr family phosphocarrier protein [Clostridia bacterium]
MTDRELVTKIADDAGGKENILTATNCMTRLRLTVSDPSLLRIDDLKALDGVMAVIADRPDHPEIVLGPGRCKKCADLFHEMDLVSSAAPSSAAAGSGKQNGNSVKALLKTFGEVFIPLIPGSIAAGICAGLATLIAQCVPGYASQPVWGSLHQLLTLINGAFMTYITAWAGYRTAEKFGATPILGGMLGMMTGMDGINTLSKLIGLWDEAEPLNAILRSGRGGVLAVFLGVWCLAQVEKQVRKRMPDSLDIIFTPLLTLLFCSIPHILIIMPAMGFVSSGICKGVELACMSPSPFIRLLVGYIAAALFLPMVATGMHHGLVALYTVQLETQGFVTLYPSLAMAGAGQVGAALAIYFLAKRMGNARLCKTIRGALPAGVLGIGEPLIYGVTLPLGKPFLTAGLGAGFGGAFVMAMQVAATVWGPSGMLGFFVMTAGPNPVFMTMLYYGLGLLISAGMGFLITSLLMHEKDLTADAPVPEASAMQPDLRTVRHGDTVLSTHQGNSFEFTVRDPLGIHARPAGQLVRLAQQFDSVIRFSANSKTASAGSVTELMALGAGKGSMLKVTAEGRDSEDALNAIHAYLIAHL